MKMNQYEIEIYWKDREKTICGVLAFNMAMAVKVAVRTHCESPSEMYDHVKTERSVRVIG